MSIRKLLYSIISALILLFVLFDANILAKEQSQNRKSGGVITNSLNPDIILTFNQIDPSQFPTISNYVAMVDQNGQPITGLTTANFTVKEDNQSVSFAVTPFGGSQLDVSVALVLDNSGSIDDNELATINQAANSFVGLMKTNDRGAIFKFTQHVSLVQDFTSNKSLLNNAINSSRPAGDLTALYDAIYDALSRTKLEANRRVIIVLTDGVKTAGSKDLSEIIDLATNSQIPVFTIGLGNNVDANVLTNIAVQTGGLYFSSASTSNLLAIFESIGGTIENQYEISYTSPNPSRDGTLRTVTITSTYGNDSDQKSRTYRAPLEGEISVDLPDNVPCSPGDKLVIQVIVGNLTGKNIYSYQFTLAYNPSVLQASTARSSGTLTSSWGNPIFNTPTSGRVQVGSYGSIPLSGSGVLVEIEFDVIGNDGDYSALNFIDFIFNNGLPPVSLYDGFVWVTSLKISGKVNYYSNDLPVPSVLITPTGGANASNTDNDGSYILSSLSRGSNYTITPSKYAGSDVGELTILPHDAACVAQAAFGINSLNNDETIAADVDKNGQLQLYDASLIAKYSIDLPKPANSHVGEWYFKPASKSFTPLEGNMFDQNFTAILLGDVTGNWGIGTPLLMQKSLQNIEKAVQLENPQLLCFRIPEEEKDSEFLSAFVELGFDKTEYKIRDIDISDDLTNCQVVKNVTNSSLKVGLFQLKPTPSPEIIMKVHLEKMNNQSTSIPVIKKYIINGKPLISKQTEVEYFDSNQHSSCEFKLLPNYPNLFNPNTQISYEIAHPTDLKITVINILGQPITTLVDEWKDSGLYKVEWNALNENGHSVGPGIYFISMDIGKIKLIRKITLLK